MHLNIARTLPRSAVNGPGERFVLWVQGCPLACPGCWNPDTWSFTKRNLREVSSVLDEIAGIADLEGVTFTGGEPFMQARALAALAHGVRALGLSVFAFTGYRRDELTHENHKALLALTDVLVDGRYDQSLREEGLTWRGSSNQRVHFLTNRYGHADLQDVPEAEFLVDSAGLLTLTGFPRPGMYE